MTKIEKRGAIYIRESTEEQDKGFSPQNQERTIREYAKREGIEVYEVYKDLISGTSASKRSDFQRMIEDAKQHNFTHILVYHTSRFARNVKDARQHKEFLRVKLGIDVISVTQPFGDWKQPTAFLNEGINELFDAYYSKQLSEWMRGAFMEKRKQGFQLGNPPLGYYKKVLGSDPNTHRPIYDKNWLVHEEESKMVVRIFEMYATGRYSLADIAQKINKEGIQTKRGSPFTYSSIKDILRNRTYLGYVYSPRRGYAEIPGNHTAIISQELFDRVEEKTQQRRGNHGRPIAQHRFYLLQGVVFCYACRKHLKDDSQGPHAKFLPKMYCETNTSHGQDLKFYGCKFRREYKDCHQDNVKCDIIDKKVVNFLKGFSVPDDIIQKTIVKLEEKMKSFQTPSHEKELATLLQKEKRLNTMYLEVGSISDEEFKEQMRELQAQIKVYRKQGIAGASKGKGKKEFVSQTEKFLQDFPKLWDSIDDAERRAWILMTIRRVWVQGKKVVAIEPYDEFKDLFEEHKKVLGQSPLVTPVWNF